jgi:ABC-type uncharacterized transport system substrate-binding protein
MASWRRLSLFLAGCTLIASAWHSSAVAAWRIFILQSYNPEYIWCEAINQGLQEALSGLPVEFDTFYLDAKRKPDAESLHQAAAQAMRRMEAFAPDLVLSVDDAAQTLVVVPQLLGLARPQIIFCGVNAPLVRYGFPADNASGVRERWHYREGFALLKRLVPAARNVAFLVEDSDAGGFITDDLQEELTEKGPYALPLAGVEKIHTFREWKQRILYYQSNADALALGLYNSILDDDGTVVPPSEVMAWTNSVNTLPTLGFSDVATEHGLLCGILESGHEQGYLAGTMARAVLAGRRAGELPPRTNERGVVMLNLQTAERLNIHIPYEIIEAAGVVLQ